MEENQQKSLATPSKVALNMHMSHLGIILGNISLVCIYLCLSSVLTALISVLIWMLAFMLMILSVGTIFLIIPNFLGVFTKGTEIIGAVTGFAFSAWPYLAPIAIVSAVGSLLLLVFDKYERHTGRIVFASILSIVSVVILILLLAGGAK